MKWHKFRNQMPEEQENFLLVDGWLRCEWAYTADEGDGLMLWVGDEGYPKKQFKEWFWCSRDSVLEDFRSR